MNTEEFVEAVREHVMHTAVSDVISLVEKPPGRRPHTELVAQSKWYEDLSEADRVMVRGLLERVARFAVFGLFTVLDGARVIDAGAHDDDFFELRHVRGDSVDVIAGPESESLHELL